MAYIIKQKVYGRDYYYLRKSLRVNGKVVSKNLGYLGKTKSEAVKKAKEILKNMSDEIKVELEKINMSIEELAVFCKKRGFVYQSADLYGGFAGFWDFGNLGAELKKNIKNSWWNKHVRERDDIVGIDGSIITHPDVWKASGHLESFTDYIVKNIKSKEVFKVDLHELENYKKDPKYEVVGEFRPMFETNVGPHKNHLSYLRPETAQLIFTNLKLVYENERLKFPFGIAQIGKAFRNEIAPREFLFRSREFEQMEIEYFIRDKMKCSYKISDLKIRIINSDGKEDIMKINEALKKKVFKVDWHAYWLGQELMWFKDLGCNLDNFRLRQHTKKELAHYSSDCWDLEYKFPFGWRELEGIADRGNHDLASHEKASKKDLKVFDEDSKEKIIANVVAEPSLGVERAFLVFMFEALYKNKKGETVLKLDPRLAPIKAAVFPIVKKVEFESVAQNVINDLKKEFNVKYDRSGSIGRRYARNDEVGTPYCITIDGDSLLKKDVTIRDRDTTKQIRVKTKDLRDVLRKLILGEIEFSNVGRQVR